MERTGRRHLRCRSLSAARYCWCAFPSPTSPLQNSDRLWVLAAHGEDIVAIGIFSRVPDVLRKTWVLIDDQHSQFGETGLKKSSVLKTEKIAVIHESVFQKRLGSLPGDLAATTEEAIKRALLLN